MGQFGLVRELVRHFFDRFFDKESISPQGQPEAGVIQTLGILAAPSGIVSILLLPLSVREWDLVAIRFLFISYSMIAIGVVMVFEWGALFPDRRDYMVLTPLPLPAFQVFLAKIASLGIFLAMFLAAINFFSVLFWQSIENRGNFVAVAGTHLAVTVTAGLFSALAIAALQGVMITVFRGAAYRRISVCVQTVVMAGLIMALFLSPLLGGALHELSRANSPYLRCYPGFWFAGMYERLRPSFAPGATDGAALAALGNFGIRATWCALGVFLLTFLPGYRSHARRVMEAPEPRPKGPGPLGARLTAAVDLMLRDPVERGVFHFISQTLSRSLKHRLFLATYGGLGAALVTMMLASGGNSRRVPLTLSFILISGLRAACNFPSDLRANWAFQISETGAAARYASATRKWVMWCAVVPLFLVLAAIEAAGSSWILTAYHFAFGVAVSMVLTEALFLGFRKAPFTCSHFPGKVNLVLLSVLYVFGFTCYSSYMGSLEDWMAKAPAAAALFFVAVAGGIAALRRERRSRAGGIGLQYEDEGDLRLGTLGAVRRSGHAGDSRTDQVLPEHTGSERCEFRDSPRRGDGLPGTERLGEIDHSENRHRADRTEPGYGAARWARHSQGHDDISPAAGLRAGRGDPVRLPDRS